MQPEEVVRDGCGRGRLRARRMAMAAVVTVGVVVASTFLFWPSPRHRTVATALRYEIIGGKPYAVISFPRIRVFSTDIGGVPPQIDESYWKISGTNRARVALPGNVIWSETNDLASIAIPLEEADDSFELEYLVSRRFWFAHRHIGPPFWRTRLLSPVFSRRDYETRRKGTVPAR